MKHLVFYFSVHSTMPQHRDSVRTGESTNKNHVLEQLTELVCVLIQAGKDGTCTCTDVDKNANRISTSSSMHVPYNVQML